MVAWDVKQIYQVEAPVGSLGSSGKTNSQIRNIFGRVRDPSNRSVSCTLCKRKNFYTSSRFTEWVMEPTYDNAI